MLCNACGSRWRTKGTLANYAPLHSRGFVLSDYEVKRNSHAHKSSSNRKGTVANHAPLHPRGFVLSDSEVNRNSREHKSSSNGKPQSMHMTDQNDGDTEYGDILPRNEYSAIGFEDDTSNRSSSGSRLSFSESTLLMGGMDGNDISGKLHFFELCCRTDSLT